MLVLGAFHVLECTPIYRKPSKSGDCNKTARNVLYNNTWNLANDIQVIGPEYSLERALLAMRVASGSPPRPKRLSCADCCGFVPHHMPHASIDTRGGPSYDKLLGTPCCRGVLRERCGGKSESPLVLSHPPRVS